ncbi:MAG TPA: sugar nucleotide-binding protein [Vicinamibacterales bacterium]|jgi:dTDP-4-dehydrorhamnose reductase
MTLAKRKVLVLGGSGMLGSMVVDALSRDPSFAITATVRSPDLERRLSGIYPSVDWRRFAPPSDEVDGLFDGQNWAVNAIGITKPLIRDDRADEIERAVEINARLPHTLARAAARAGVRIIQIATDCVFSGTKGAYTEADAHDALDVYGKTKSLGETFHDNVHHLRCSIIGPEPKDFKFLIEWFRRQPAAAKLKGFANHRWNGVTTLQFAKLCGGIVRDGVALGHLVHVIPTGTLSKAEMLHEFASAYGRADISIDTVDAPTVIDRTLATNQRDLNAALWSAAGYDRPPSVPEMIRELARFDYRAVPA